jgi:hypothetical protein
MIKPLHPSKASAAHNNFKGRPGPAGPDGPTSRGFRQARSGFRTAASLSGFQDIFREAGRSFGMSYHLDEASIGPSPIASS